MSLEVRNLLIKKDFFMSKILLVLFVLHLFSVAEAKTYVSNEFSFSVWLPDEMEYIHEAKPNSGEPEKFRAEYRGLNVSVTAAHGPNTDGKDFNDLAFTEKYLESLRQLTDAVGGEFSGYHNCPVPNHYYAISVIKQQEKVSVHFTTTIHRKFIQVFVNAPAHQESIARKIVDSFTCIDEHKDVNADFYFRSPMELHYGARKELISAYNKGLIKSSASLNEAVSIGFKDKRVEVIAVIEENKDENNYAVSEKEQDGPTYVDEHIIFRNKEEKAKATVGSKVRLNCRLSDIVLVRVGEGNTKVNVMSYVLTDVVVIGKL